MHFVKKEELETGVEVGLYDVTGQVQKVIEDSGIKNGLVVIQTMHTTTGIYVNEKEEFLESDVVLKLGAVAPDVKGMYAHDNIPERDCPPDEPLNGHAHIKAILYSSVSVSLGLCKGKLQLGRYQRIFFAEFDGPCPRKHKDKRKYLIIVMGE